MLPDAVSYMSKEIIMLPDAVSYMLPDAVS